MSSQNPLKLSFGLTFDDLYARDGLVKLQQEFDKYLKEKDSEIAARFLDLRDLEADSNLSGPRHEDGVTNFSFGFQLTPNSVSPRLHDGVQSARYALSKNQPY
jgi:hypothetical protein